MKITCLLLALSATIAAGRDAYTVDPGTDKFSLTDLTGTGLTRSYCRVNGKNCPGASAVESKYAGTEFQCVARCSQRRDCYSFQYASKQCHIQSKRCSPGSMVAAAGTHLHRLKEGEKCPAGSSPYEAPKEIYGNTYCMLWGKTCKGDTYYPKPARISPFSECLKLCSRIRTCTMVNYKDGLCDAIVSAACTDSQLVDNAGNQNFLRLRKDNPTCPNNRGPPAATPPPATQPPATQPPATQPPATQPPATQPPPKRTDAYCSRKYGEKHYIPFGESEITASCDDGCVMVACHCRPYARCDGARFTADGKCRVNRRTGGRKGERAARKFVWAKVRCQPAWRYRTWYGSTDDPDKPIRCPNGYRQGDCSFYEKERRGLKQRRYFGRCGVKRKCGRGRCTRTAVCKDRL